MPSFYIVLQNKIPNLDEYVNGSQLLKRQETLDLLSKKFDVKPLMSFYSTNGDDVRSVLDCEAPEELGIKIPREEWFTAEEGLPTIRALLNHFEKTNSPSDEKRMAELRKWNQVLSAAREHQVRWHLAVDC